jgi:hypothetical protein
LPSSSGEKLCPICDSPLQPGSKKCGFCGTDLSIFDIEVEESKPAPAPVAPPPKQSVESRIEEIFSKSMAPEKPASAKSSESVIRDVSRHAPPPPEPVIEQEPEPEPEPLPELEPEPKVEVQAEAPAEEKKETPGGEYFECPQCGSIVEAMASSCPKCGVLFAEEGADTFQCPACNTLVSIDATSCPGCGAVFVEPEQAEAATVAPKPEPVVETPVVKAEPPPKPKAAPAPPKEEEEKKGFFSMFKKAKKEEPPAPKPSKPSVPAEAHKSAVREVTAAPAMKPAEPKPAEARVAREVPPPPAGKDKGKELARMVAEMKPLLALAREKEVEIGESKELIDQAATAGRERQLDKAIDLVRKSKAVLMSKIDGQLSEDIVTLSEEVKIARGFGGDIARASTYLQEIERARSSGDAEAAYVYVDKVRSELLPITGRYNESKKKYAAVKDLIANAEFFIVDTKEARSLMVDASKALDMRDFDKLDMQVKAAQDRLYKAIPPRMSDEMRKAKDDLLEAKMKNVNITPLITILKSSTNLMKAGDYAQALKEMREFRELIKKTA